MDKMDSEVRPFNYLLPFVCEQSVVRVLAVIGEGKVWGLR